MAESLLAEAKSTGRNRKIAFLCGLNSDFSPLFIGFRAQSIFSRDMLPVIFQFADTELLDQKAALLQWFFARTQAEFKPGSAHLLSFVQAVNANPTFRGRDFSPIFLRMAQLMLTPDFQFQQEAHRLMVRRNSGHV